MRARPFLKKYSVRHGNALPPIHPGEIIREEYLRPWGMEADELSDLTGINVAHMYRLVRGNAHLTVEDAFRLARYMRTSVDFWLGLQEAYDVKSMVQSDILRADIMKIKPRRKDDQ